MFINNFSKQKKAESELHSGNVKIKNMQKFNQLNSVVKNDSVRYKTFKGPKEKGKISKAITILRNEKKILLSDLVVKVEQGHKLKY